MEENKPEIVFDENGVPAGSTIPIQNFFFLIFYSDPNKGRIYIYPDGDEHRRMMSHKNFLDFVISLAGYTILPLIHEALSTYGTFWLYDREKNSVRHIAVRGSDDIRTIQGQIQKALRRETTPEQNPLNPAANLAYTPVDVTIPEGKNPFNRDTDSDDDTSTPPLSVKIKR
jgi:hypothetical protein